MVVLQSNKSFFSLYQCMCWCSQKKITKFGPTIALIYNPYRLTEVKGVAQDVTGGSFGLYC